MDPIDLIMACKTGNLGKVKKLIGAGANIHAYNDAALRGAVENGHLEVVKYLVKHGANIHAVGSHSLGWAVSDGHLEVVKYLAEHGANIQEEYTLEVAIWRGHLKIVKYLVERGADIHYKNEGALQDAVSKNYPEIIAYLIEKGADVRKVDFEKLVSRRKYKGVLYLLLDALSKEELMPLLLSNNSRLRKAVKAYLRSRRHSVSNRGL
jgi:ankyrin repeat protein